MGGKPIVRDVSDIYQKKLTIRTKTGSTDSGGNLLLFNNTDYHIASVKATSGNYILLPIAWHSNNATYVRVLDVNMNAVTGTSLTVEYTIIE